ncbi:MAG: hypothetical protein DME24_25545 [Verrucomicrobia bacterium]|nr:MAG: hypothetical protein DME24_25545 [Verrucomicrobiota bacterium]
MLGIVWKKFAVCPRIQRRSKQNLPALRPESWQVRRHGQDPGRSGGVSEKEVVRTKTNRRAPVNGRVTIDLKQPLTHPERQRRLDKLSPDRKSLRDVLLRRRAAQLNLGELDPGDGNIDNSIDTQVAEMLIEVKTLSATAMLMAHTLAALRHEVGTYAETDGFWQSVEELPAEIKATVEATLQSAKAVESQLRAAGVLLDESKGAS